MNTSRKFHEFLLKRYPDAHTSTRNIADLKPGNNVTQKNNASLADSFFSQLTARLPAYPVHKNPFVVLQNSVMAIFYTRIKSLLSDFDHLIWNQEELALKLSQQSVRALQDEPGQLCFLTSQQSAQLRFASWQEMFAHYPLIRKNLTLHDQHIINSLRDVLSKIDHDKELLTNTFKIPLFSIKNIQLSLGEFNQPGKSIVRIDFSKGSVVYKPRGADNEAFTLALLDLINAEIMQLRIGIPAFINRHEYSWHEYIAFQNPVNEQQALNYYRKIGASLLFFYMINGSNLDHKKIICVNNTPYFVELETILSRPQLSGAFSDSVLNTNIIPSLAGNPADKYVCGIGVPGGEEDVLCSHQQFIRNNIPLFNHLSLTHEALIKAVNDGFESMRLLIKDNQLIVPFIKSFPLLKGRVFLRPVHSYYEMMQMANQPAYMSDPDARNIFLFCILYEETKALDVLQYEHRAISEGRIPLFYINIATGKYYTADGNELNINDNHSFKNNMTKVYRMINTDEEIVLQKKLMNLSLNTLYPGKVAISKKQTFIDKTVDFMAGIENSYKKEEVILNVTTEANGGRKLSKMNSDIFTGLSGAAFMQLCNTIINRTPLKERKLEQLYTRANKYNTNETFGCFEMNGGLLYLEYLFHKNLICWFDTALFNKRLFNIINIIRNREASTDIFSGIAGVLIVCTRMYLLCPHKIYESAIKYLASRLVEKAFYMDNGTVAWSNKTIGFARGNSGIVYALLLANNVLNNKQINELVVKALKYEQQFKMDDGWKGVDTPDRDEAINSWYHGATGIYLSRTAMLDENYLESNELTDILYSDIEHYNDTKKEREINQHLSLCHGVYGSAMIDPLSYAEYLHVDYSAYTPSEDKSLMLGRPGALYSQLFINHSNREIPNLLLLK